MNIVQALAIVTAGQQLVAAGVATVENIRTWIRSLHADLSDVDLNAICDTIAAGAARHQALADADAGTTA